MKKNPVVKAMIGRQFGLDARDIEVYGRIAGQAGGGAVCAALGLGAAAPVCAYVGGFLGRVFTRKLLEVAAMFRAAKKQTAVQWALQNFEGIVVPKLGPAADRILAVRAYLAERDEALGALGRVSRDFAWANDRLNAAGAVGVRDVAEWQTDRSARWNTFLSTEATVHTLSAEVGDFGSTREKKKYKYDKRRKRLKAIADDPNRPAHDRQFAHMMYEWIEPLYKVLVIERDTPDLHYDAIWWLWLYPSGIPSPPDVPFDFGLIGADPNSISVAKQAQEALRLALPRLRVEAEQHLAGGFIAQKKAVPSLRSATDFASVGHVRRPKSPAKTSVATVALAGGLGIGALLLLA